MRRLQTFPPLPRNGTVRPKPSRLLRLTEAALSVSADGSAKQERRSREDGRVPQVEAIAKRQDADPVQSKRRAAVLQQSPLRSRRRPHSAALGLLGKRWCASGQSRAKHRALRRHVQKGVLVPSRQATPLVRIEDNRCESWPRPSQSVAQQRPPYPSACRVIFHGGQIVMMTDILRCHTTDQSGDHL